MPAKAIVPPIQRYEHLAGPRELSKLARRRSLLEHCVAQRARQLVDNRGTSEEPRALSRKGSEHLVAEVLGHEVIVTGEAPQAAAHVILVAKRQRGEIEPRRPSFGLPGKCLHRREV